MNNIGQELIRQMHTDIGVSDAFIADMCEVSREHINRVKQGKLLASQELTEALTLLHTLMSEQGFTPKRKPYVWKHHTARSHTSPAHRHTVNYPSYTTLPMSTTNTPFHTFTGAEDYR